MSETQKLPMVYEKQELSVVPETQKLPDPHQFEHGKHSSPYVSFPNYLPSDKIAHNSALNAGDQRRIEAERDQYDFLNTTVGMDRQFPRSRLERLLKIGALISHSGQDAVNNAYLTYKREKNEKAEDELSTESWRYIVMGFIGAQAVSAYGVVKDKALDAFDAGVDKTIDLKDVISEKSKRIAGFIGPTALKAYGIVKDKALDAFDAGVDKASDIASSAREKTGEAIDALGEKSIKNLDTAGFGAHKAKRFSKEAGRELRDAITKGGQLDTPAIDNLDLRPDSEPNPPKPKDSARKEARKWHRDQAIRRTKKHLDKAVSRKGGTKRQIRASKRAKISIRRAQKAQNKLEELN
jgi:hypothetical protein